MRYANDDLRLFMSRYTTHLQTCLRASTGREPVTVGRYVNNDMQLE